METRVTFDQTEPGSTRTETKIWGESIVRGSNSALRRALTALEGRSGKVLETGCGAGRFIRTIKIRRPDLEAFGCDITAEAIDIARTYNDGVDYRFGSLTELPYADNEFDIIVLFDVLEHLHEPEKGLAEINRVLKPGGTFHALIPCEGHPFTLHWLMWKLGIVADLKERHGWHVQRFTHGSVRRLLSSHHLDLRHVTYSMHPIGQVKDILTYLEREDWFGRWRLNNGLFRLFMKGIWGLSYLESYVLSKLPFSATVMHVTCEKKGGPLSNI